ncbi:MAG: hypothetical protein QM808_17525 [Steroidobacteraceae bacterium]
MTQGLVFTQFTAHGTGGDKQAPFGRVPELAEASSRVLYQSVENPAEYARMEYFDQYGKLGGMRFDLSERELDVARYRCIEASDTGTYAEQHKVLMLVAFNVPEHLFCEVEEWYEHEHAMLLMRAQGWYRVRRYHVPMQAGGQRWNHLAFHELSDVKVLDSQERKIARSTPWRARYEAQAWFQAAGRWIYRRLDA